MSLWSAISIVIGAILAVYGILTAFVPDSNPSWVSTVIKQIVSELEKDVATAILQALGSDINLTFTSWFVGPTVFGMYFAIIAAAVITAAVMIYWAWSNWATLCGSPSFGTMACITGVVNDVAGAFGTAHSVLFGFTGNQPRADVVVKSLYWPLVDQNSPSFVLCAACDNCPSSTIPANPAAGCSPEVPCLYHDAKVCAAALGGAIGATVGAAIGAVLGILAGIAIAGSLGCLAAGPLAWVCWLVLLLAIIVAIAITAAIALVGAMAGSGIGQAVAGGSSSPGGSAPLTPGTYVTITGNLAAAKQTNGANTIWFADWVPNLATGKVEDQSINNNSGTSILGHSTGSAPFCFTDPDTNLAGALDVCPSLG
jgi:hypothetical protein